MRVYGLEVDSPDGEVRKYLFYREEGERASWAFRDGDWLYRTAERPDIDSPLDVVSDFISSCPFKEARVFNDESHMIALWRDGFWHELVGLGRPGKIAPQIVLREDMAHRVKFSPKAAWAAWEKDYGGAGD